MPHVSEHVDGAAARRPASTRGRWLFAIVMFAIGIVPVSAIARAVGPSTPACPGGAYSVVSGDSWSRIASRSGVSMTALLNANKATTATVIHPGQTLCLPPNAVTSPATTTPATPAPTAPAAKPTGGVAIDVFPAQGPCSFTDTYGAPRSGGRALTKASTSSTRRASGSTPSRTGR